MINEKPLIIDYINDLYISPDVLTESSHYTKTGKLLVQGVIQRANAENQNKRVYPKWILEREVEKYLKLVKERRSTGELDHPDSTVINLANVSHLITDLWWENDELLAKIEILKTPSGNIVTELIKAGIPIGISSRGLGSTKDLGNGRVEVLDDYEILCWDLVSNPSTQGSFVNPITEGKRYINESSKYENINNLIIDVFTSLDYNCGSKCEI